jgi:hypothetical protein
MRWFTAAVLLVGVIVCSTKADALDCTPGPADWMYEAAEGVDTPVEQQRYDAEARAALERLERTPIIFRGRIASASYLRKTKGAVGLLVFDDVEILKGSLPRTLADRRLFLLQELWCDGGCRDDLTMRWPRGDTKVVAAYPNVYIGPSKAVEFPRFGYPKFIYEGRIDAVLGLCSSGGLPPLALELLNAPDDEIARLKREYLPRRPQ